MVFEIVPYIREKIAMHRISRSLLLSISIVLTATAVAEVKTLQVDSFETGLEVLNEGMGHANWVDNDQVVIAALQDGVHDIPGADPHRARARVMLVNFKTRKFSVIDEDAMVLRFDRQTKNAIIGHAKLDVVSRQIHVDPDGTTREIARYGQGAKLPSDVPIVPPHTVAKILDHIGDGYLLADSDHIGQLRDSGEPIPTTWVRPNKPPVKLVVPFQEIGIPEYIDFMGKYLLNSWDSQKVSSTNATANRIWKRPYQLAPYRLLSSDGSIQETPYPTQIINAGVKSFGDLLFTRRGLAVTTWDTPGFGIYLYKENALYRVMGGASPGRQRSTVANNMTAINEPSLSPDGCKIAYLHYFVSSASATLSMPQSLAMVDLCKELK